ncbi:MAG: response regulator [Pirellulaceae bacterium]|nr:response regulator [Planctomycetales bacterium]
MANVLIVDDSAVDRRLAGGLLETESFDVRYATSGTEAMEMIAQQVPDVVLIDLVMPGMDGLELVSAIRRDYPLLPAILMTSMGNEDIAVRALRKGAASYVPKQVMGDELLSTVRSVLEVSQRQKVEKKLLGYLQESYNRFCLENDRRLIAPLVAYVQEKLALFGICDDSELLRVGIALDEALVNALYHGNLEVSSDLREEEGDAYQSLAVSRSTAPPFCDRRLHVDVRVSREQAVIEIRDEGPGFDPESLPDPTDPANLERLSGRGVLLMRTFMDEVRFSQRGNHVMMVKRRSEPKQ